MTCIGNSMMKIIRGHKKSLAQKKSGNYHQVFLSIKLPVAPDLKMKVFYLGPKSKLLNPTKILKFQTILYSQQTTLCNINFYKTFSSLLMENMLIIP